MRYVFVADDFTGASDTLATLSRAGLRTRLYLAPPTPEEVRDLDAFGIATAARSMKRDALTATMRHIAEALKPHAPEVIHLKVCSTFDSSVDIGNIATAMSMLTESLAPATTVVLGGQPSLGRYCLFGNLFAKGGDGNLHRIDRHPVMQDHPVTPMREADLRRHFAALGLPNLALFDLLALRSGEALPSTPMLCDVLDESDQRTLKGRLVNSPYPQLWVGASSVAETCFPATTRPSLPDTLPGPLLVFAGSRSPMTAAQVMAATGFTKVAIPAASLAQCPDVPCRQIRQLLASGNHVLAVLGEDSAHGLSPADMAQRSAELLTHLLSERTAGTVLIAGGDTSSLAIHALAPCSIDYAGQLSPGVAICRAHFADGKRLPIILKGGQMGGLDLFDTVSAMVRQEPL
ncbi:four-carbon acid sugar kinase family protein [Halomonas sp. MCCC 1A11036]|uniref:Four-carbon acid sugar kinase family protein n=1 Tax=Billgrantia zhangzhouensis TaxID=2733481 RepID=A0ABS9AIR5_9GAMM|nr:four-carbon acid sugar kinase family protein [Halomonas zhangzhouensis]MCE8021671.1 four-carbon acid sugar kinase family protein [Halomonas zhangzhouensis]